MADETRDLDEMDTDEVIEFPPPERKISTQPYDVSIQTLKDQWDSELLVIPDMQREYVWDTGRASRLIESLLLNIPVPPVYFAERKDSVLEVVDGHQRLRSIVRFLNNEFALAGLGILSEYMRKRFHQLPQKEQRFLQTRTLRAVVIGPDSHPNMKFEVFERLNTGGIALNAQELRNSLYRGSLNDTLRTLARECEPFRGAIGSKNPRRRMVDEELILRWFALRDGIKEYKPPLKRFLNEYMQAHQIAEEDWLAPRRVAFDTTMDLIYRTLGEQAFRLIDVKGDPLRDEEGKLLPRGVNRALFDAQALAFSWVMDGDEVDRARVVKLISQTLEQPDLQDAVRRATGDRARILLRIKYMARTLQDAGFELSAPHIIDV